MLLVCIVGRPFDGQVGCAFGKESWQNDTRFSSTFERSTHGMTRPKYCPGSGIRPPTLHKTRSRFSSLTHLQHHSSPSRSVFTPELLRLESTSKPYLAQQIVLRLESPPSPHLAQQIPFSSRTVSQHRPSASTLVARPSHAPQASTWPLSQHSPAASRTALALWQHCARAPTTPEKQHSVPSAPEGMPGQVVGDSHWSPFQPGSHWQKD